MASNSSTTRKSTTSKRGSKATGKSPAPARITHPTTVQGATDTSLENSVNRRTSRITILNKTGSGVKAVVRTKKAGEKPHQLGNLKWFFYALSYVAIAGTGNSPDGAALWLNKMYPLYLKNNPGLAKYRLSIEVPESARAGVQGYVGTVEDLMTIASTKAGMIEKSLEVFGVTKSQRRTPEAKETASEVTFS
jgi:hypothetical protein